MEGWRQRRLGSMGTIGKRRNKEEERKKEWKNERKGLTLTGLLMEGACRAMCGGCGVRFGRDTLFSGQEQRNLGLGARAIVASNDHQTNCTGHQIRTPRR